MKTQNPIIGRAKGSAGGMTFSKNYDKNVARAKAFEVSNPKTTAQTTERSFFAEVMKLVSSVSEDQLRSIFSVKPKTKSRRNALTSQITAAYSVDGTTKSVDLSKLQAIGNGEKVFTIFFDGFFSNDGINFTPTEEMFGNVKLDEANAIVVLMSKEYGIQIINSELLLEELTETTELSNFGAKEDVEYFGYVTCSEVGENVYGKPFGTFKIKTRATDSTNNRGTRSLSSPTKQATAPKTVKPEINVEPSNEEPQPSEAPTSEEENQVTV